MSKLSAGILLYRFKNGNLEVLIAHPGGPFWANKDLGAWSIPKGLVAPGEDTLKAAQREFLEETGHQVSGNFIPLTPVKLRAGKIVIPFAIEHDLNATNLKSNTFTREWPPGSGRQQEFPEIDRAEWCNVETAKIKLNPAQAEIVNELVKRLE